MSEEEITTEAMAGLQVSQGSDASAEAASSELPPSTEGDAENASADGENSTAFSSESLRTRAARLSP